MNKVIKKTLWKLFPNTVYQIWKAALDTGIEQGRKAQQAYIEDNLRRHDLKDFDEPGLTLGYQHAVKAIRGELTEVV